MTTNETIEAVRDELVREWAGSPCPIDPDNYWIDDVTGERVDALTGERTPRGWSFAG